MQQFLWFSFIVLLTPARPLRSFDQMPDIVGNTALTDRLVLGKECLARPGRFATFKVRGWLEADEGRCKPVPLDRNVRHLIAHLMI